MHSQRNVNGSLLFLHLIKLKTKKLSVCHPDRSLENSQLIFEVVFSSKVVFIERG